MKCFRNDFFYHYAKHSFITKIFVSFLLMYSLFLIYAFIILIVLCGYVTIKKNTHTQKMFFSQTYFFAIQFINTNFQKVFRT